MISIGMERAPALSFAAGISAFLVPGHEKNATTIARSAQFLRMKRNERRLRQNGSPV
jgi:hypothetical protein